MNRNWKPSTITSYTNPVKKRRDKDRASKPVHFIAKREQRQLPRIGCSNQKVFTPQLRITCTKLLVPRQYGKIFDGAKDGLITHRLHIPIILNNHQFNRSFLAENDVI
ncbi:hypothetical protein V8G54_021068 [Vigna mungo]|uniref:Uncharacterized protein n=1 Tax=Vigna mungo TaxID=3915 RepID=A0AAQ3NDN4_VIGMU